MSVTKWTANGLLIGTASNLGRAHSSIEWKVPGQFTTANPARRWRDKGQRHSPRRCWPRSRALRRDDQRSRISYGAGHRWAPAPQSSSVWSLVPMFCLFVGTFPYGQPPRNDQRLVPPRNQRPTAANKESPKRGFAGALGAKTAPGMRRVGTGCAVSQQHYPRPIDGG